MSSQRPFHVSLLREEHRIQTISLLMKSFFRDEPLAKYLRLGEPRDFAERVVDDALRDQCSFVALYTQPNQLVGVCLSEIKHKNEVAHSKNEWEEKVDYILRLLDHMHQKIDLFDEFNTEDLLHIFIINVDKSYRGHGLASRLISASIDHAKKKNVGGIYAETTSIYSLNCFKKQGFQVYHQMIYLDYDQIRLADMTDASEDQCQLVARKL
jgi:ribosomal protein S18 acetylase RimI-like enzyme